MKKCYFIALFIFFGTASFAQTPQTIDSLKQLLSKEKEPLKKFALYQRLMNSFVQNSRIDSVQNYLPELFKIASQQKNDSLLILSYAVTARYYDFKTDTKEEINYALKGLAIAEKKHSPALLYIYDDLASAYNDIENPAEALKYARKGKMLFENLQDKQGNEVRYMNIIFQFVDAFNKLNQPDSVLHYANSAIELVAKYPNPYEQRLLLSYVGIAYERLGNDELAESNYANSINKDTSGERATDALTAQNYSRFLLKQGKLVQAKLYALKAMKAATVSQFKRGQLEAANTIRKIYEAMHQPDSAYYFAKQELAFRDSIFNQSKLNDIQNMAFNEKIREQEEAIKKEEEAHRHRQNLQYAVIALAILSFIILFFLFSRSVVANEGLIRFLGVLSLLILYEFINLLIHPFLAAFTHESPVWMLVIMVAIGALLVPLHHKLEQWLTHKLVEKNNKIRLAAAKKTIEKLEGKG